MWHNKDGGWVYWDRVFTNKHTIDLACIACGKRWHVQKGNALARWLLKSE